MQLAFSMKRIKVLSFIFSVVAIIFIVFSIYTWYYHANATNNWEEVSAIVKSVNRDKEVFIVEFNTFSEVNILVEVTHYYSSSINVGDILIAYVNPLDAREIYLAQEVSIPVVLTLLSVASTLFVLCFFFINLRKDLNNKKCYADGRRIRVQIRDVIDTHFDILNKQVYRIVVSHENKEYRSQAYYHKDEVNGPMTEKFVDLYLLGNKHYIDLNSVRTMDIFDEKFQF